MKPNFEDVVKNYIRLVYFFAKKSLSQQDDVDDAVQETFLKAMKRYDNFTFTSEGELKSWLLTICRNTILDGFKAQKTNGHPVSLDQNEIDVPGDDNIEAWLEAESSREDIRQIARELKDMKPDEQEVIRLRIFEEMEFKQVASALAITEATAKMRFYRAISRLKEAVICNTKTL